MIDAAPNGQIQKKMILYLKPAYFIAELKKSCNLLSVLGFVKMS